jgi:hypothetical protein
MRPRRRAAQCRDELAPPHPSLPKGSARLGTFGGRTRRARACCRSSSEGRAGCFGAMVASSE